MRGLSARQQTLKAIAIVVAVFCLLAGAIFILAYYYRVGGQVAGENETVNLTQSPADYRDSFKRLFRGYLILESDANLLSDEFLAKTIAIKNELLLLRVPTELREVHLRAVLALTEIEQGAAARDIGIVLPNIYQLRDIVDNL